MLAGLQFILDIWNGLLAQMWELLTTGVSQYANGQVWNIVQRVLGGVQDGLVAIGLGLLVLFFAAGVIKSCGSFAELKKPEHILKLFMRFILARTVVVYGMELMFKLFEIIAGVIVTIQSRAGIASGVAGIPAIPTEVVEAFTETNGLLQILGDFSLIWMPLLILGGTIYISVLAIKILLSVWTRFFKIYIYTAIAPIPLSAFAGESTQEVGKTFVKSYCGVLMEGVIIALALVIYTSLQVYAPFVDPQGNEVVKQLALYLFQVIIGMNILHTVVTKSDNIVREIMGLVS